MSMDEIRVRLPRVLDATGSSLRERGRLHPIGPVSITLNIAPLHRVTLTLAENDLPLAMHDLVEVYNQNGSVGVYRVKHIGDTKRKERQIELAHGLDTLSDAHIAVIEPYKGDVEGMLRKILAAQKQPICGKIPWVLGVCEDPNPWKKEIKYDNALECLTDIAKTEEDYMFTFDMSVFPWVLNFVRRDSTVMSEWRMNRNVDQCQISWDDGDQCTRLYLSVTDEDSETVTDKDNHDHDIVTVSEGYYPFDDAEGQADWGIVEKPAGVDRASVPTQAALDAWVAGYFARHRQPALQIQIDGQEYVRITGERLDEAHMGRISRVTMPEYRSVFNERLVSVTYPDALRKPTLVRLSLANKRQTSEGSFAEIRQKASRASSGASSARATAQNAAAEIEKQKIRYDLRVEQDDRHWAIIASEEWFEEMASGQMTLVGKYNADFGVTARKIGAALSVTGVALDSNGMPVMNGNDYVFDGSNNTLIAQIQLQAGRYDRIIQATGISETAVPGEVSLVTQVSQTHQQLSQAAIATGLVWDASLNEGAGGFKVDPNAISSSVYKQLAGQISAKVTASDVKTQVEAYGYLDLTAAKNAAAAEIGAQLDSGTSSISAKVKALVEGDTSLIQLVAQQVDVVSELASYSGDIELRGTLYSEGGFDTTGDSKFEGNLVIDGGNLNLINGAALQIGGTAINPVNSISLVPPTGTSTTYTLKYTDLGGTEHTVGTFSRAASIQTVSGSWSGSTYQIVADANGTALPLNETLTFTVGTTPSGGASSTTIDRFSSLHKNTLTVKGSSQPSAAYIRQYIIDASGVYSDGETAGRTQAVTDATLSVDTPYKLGSVIKIYPRVTFDADTEKSANPMDAQLPALATNSSGTPTAAPSTLVAGSTVYPYVQIGSVNFFGSGYTVPSGGDGQSVDDITIRNNPVPASLVEIDGSRYVQGTANLTAWHNEEIGDDAYVPVDLKDDTAQVRMNIESILSSAESAALSGLNLSGWQLNSSSHDAENLVRDANNTTKFTVSLPPAANWDINVGAFNSSGSATIRVRPVLGGTIGTEVVTGTISDSNLKPENIKSGVTIFGKVGTYTGGNYTQATVTLQGEAENVYVPTPSGIAYYQAGTAVERYMGGSSFTVQGSKVSVTPVGTKYWYKWHPSTETPTSAWYSVHTSDPGGSFVIRYAAGTATDYYKAGTVTKYERGASVSITPIKSTAMIQVAQEVRYKQGTTDSTTYYTRTSS